MRRLTTVAGSLAVTGVLLVPISSAEAAPLCSTVPVVAHRGMTANHVENTTGAVRAAIKRGFAFEVDIRTTASDGLALMHDGRVNRTTRGTGRIADKTDRQVRRLVTNDGQRVPFVAAVLRTVRDRPRSQAVLELKALTRASQDRLSARIKEYGVQDQVSAISFEPALLRAFENRTPAVSSSLITGALPDPVTLPWDGVDVPWQLLTPEWTASMLEQGHQFTVRNTNETAGWDAGGRYQAGWTMTDNPVRYRDHCSGG